MLRLKIERIKPEIRNAATFFLSEADGKPVNYLPGQFITLIFKHHDEEIRRSYSISSSPDEKLLSITVKRVANGEISRFLLSHAQPGDIWDAVEPSGKFVIKDYKDQRDLFFFAAGSGIAPIYAQLKYLFQREGKSNIILVYSNQEESEILFKEELDALERQYPGRFKVIHQLSSMAQRLNNFTVEQLVPQHARFDLQQAQFYLCGPFSYMRMIRLMLLFMGIHTGNIRKENFVLPTVEVTANTLFFAPKNLQIIFRGETHNLVAGENQSILQAALQNNIPLPYSCRAGICSSCSAKCTSGNVRMTDNDVLTDADLAEGWILTCTGYAADDDVVISFGE